MTRGPAVQSIARAAVIDVLLHLLSLHAVATAPIPTDPPAASAATRSIDVLVIDARVDAIAELEAALALRLDGCPTARSDRARPPRTGELFAYLEIEAGDRTTLRLTLGDARVWVRTIDAPPADRTREIATTVANLVAGIALDEIAPDLQDVPLPAPLQPVQAPPIAPKPVVAPPPVRAPSSEWGLGVDAAAVLELGPPSPAGFGAAGVAVRGGARLRRGALLEASVRGAWFARGPYTLTRLRLELAAGYALRRRAFALHTTGGLTVEPWFVTSAGGLAPGERRPLDVLLGGLVRISPQWRVNVGRRALHLGPYVELAGSVVPGADGGVARVRHGAAPDTVDVYRVGGLEIAGGLALALWTPRR